MGNYHVRFGNRYRDVHKSETTGISYLVHTLCAGTVCEKYFVEKYLYSHPGKTLQNIYENPDCIGYRNIVMCPGHLVAKWAEELRNEIPYAKTVIINDFSQLVNLREEGKKRNGREFYVISKDFGKLSYQMEPTPTKRRYQKVYLKECGDCGTSFNTPGSVCPSCKSKNYKLKKTHSKKEGMVCPHCNQLLFPYLPISPDNEDIMPLDFDGFNAQKQLNSKCYYCDTELWQPHVANLGATEKKHPWVRVSHHVNASKKGTKTEWMLRSYMEQHLARIRKTALNVIENEGCRKYSPVLFIKKYLKGYFDIAVFDEAHVYKGGRTGQGHAMHALIKASKKQLALTGTIAGGCANHLFYLLYRLDPQRMKEKGFSFYDEMAFSEEYGKVERTYQYHSSSVEAEYNASCKGRQLSSPKVKPGISPLIFMDFLLDRTTFLDLSDMSRHLPKLEEKVVTVPCDTNESELLCSYRRTVNQLKAASRQKGNGGKGLLATMLQFSLSYMDKPFDLNPILNPVNGEVLVELDSYPSFKDTSSFENLLSKEKKLVELVREEISQGRNVFVYAEYTASAELCITYRLKDILERHCELYGQVEVLESSSPSASKREEWIRKKAQQGIKVFITNPRCVETGLDFCFNIDGVAYNYPTIIFYQLGYSLFTIWQASRRAYRLNQKENCKTIYMAWAGTVQQAVIELIAEKQAATAVIQGKFSTEGLSAMANGVDASIKLVQAMSKKDSVSENQLQQMFDVLAVAEDSNMAAEYKPMLLLHELIDLAEEEQPVVQATYNLLNMSFEMFLMAQQQAMPKVTTPVPAVMQKKVKRTNNKVLTGQMSLF